MNFRDEYPGLPETITRDVAKHLDLDGGGGGVASEATPKKLLYYIFEPPELHFGVS